MSTRVDWEKKERGGDIGEAICVEVREEAAEVPREGWIEAEEAMASARRFRERGMWKRDTEGKGDRRERQWRMIVWREGSEEKVVPESRVRMMRESPYMEMGDEIGRPGKEKRKEERPRRRAEPSAWLTEMKGREREYPMGGQERKWMTAPPPPMGGWGR